MSDPLAELVLRTLKAAEKEAPGAEVQVHAWNEGAANTRFARNEITTAGDHEETGLAVHLAFGRRHARTQTNQTDGEQIRALLRRAAAMAKLSPEDPERMPLLPPQRYAPAAASWDDEVAKLGAGERARICGESLAMADEKKLQVAGFLRRSGNERVLGSSAGLAARYLSTEVSLTVTARTPDGTGSGWGGREAHRLGDLEASSLPATAIDKALRSAGARPLDPGKYTVVLEPQAVQEMLAYMVSEMDARSADEGRSFFAHKLGERVFSPLCTLRSDPGDPLAPAAPFDDEGQPRRPMAWIEGGVVRALSTSRYWAAKTGKEPTGRQGSFHLAGGTAGSIDELLKGITRGLLITRFWYTRMLEPKDVLLTGLTRDGVFLIENGRVTRPISNFRYNESPINVLKKVDAMTRTTTRVPTYGGVWRVPALRTHEFTMASTSAAV